MRRSICFHFLPLGLEDENTTFSEMLSLWFLSSSFPLCSLPSIPIDQYQCKELKGASGIKSLAEKLSCRCAANEQEGWILLM